MENNQKKRRLVRGFFIHISCAVVTLLLFSSQQCVKQQSGSSKNKIKSGKVSSKRLTLRQELDMMQQAIADLTDHYQRLDEAVEALKEEYKSHV
jgi:uncharacterized protein YlxW (UPF0749 family)